MIEANKNKPGSTHLGTNQVTRYQLIHVLFFLITRQILIVYVINHKNLYVTLKTIKWIILINKLNYLIKINTG